MAIHFRCPQDLCFIFFPVCKVEEKLDKVTKLGLKVCLPLITMSALWLEEVDVEAQIRYVRTNRRELCFLSQGRRSSSH